MPSVPGAIGRYRRVGPDFGLLRACILIPQIGILRQMPVQQGTLGWAIWDHTYDVGNGTYTR